MMTSLSEEDEYKFTIEELEALYKFLEHQHIAYEDLTLLETVRKISRIVNEKLAG